MTTRNYIIVVDDEAPTREMIGEYLGMQGFDVQLCDGGRSLRQAINVRMPDLVVLDLNMPEEDGLSIIRDLKQRTGVAVIMLTATASPVDRIVGLELGADDYLAKPCELRELLARIRAVLRRSAAAKPAVAQSESKSTLVQFGVKWLNVEAQTLRDADGNEHQLRPQSSVCSKSSPTTQEGFIARTAPRPRQRPRSEAFDRAIDIRIMRFAARSSPIRPTRA